MAARWKEVGEGIGRNSHTLELQELGGLLGIGTEIQPSIKCIQLAHAFRGFTESRIPNHAVRLGTSESQQHAD